MIKKRAKNKKEKEIRNLQKEACDLNKKLTGGVISAISVAFRKPIKKIIKGKEPTLEQPFRKALTESVLRKENKLTKEDKILASKVTIREPVVKKPGEEKRFVFQKISIGKIIITLIVLSVLFFNLYYFGLFKGTCDNVVCFNSALASCSPVKFNKVVDNNFYEYSVFRSLGDSCKIRITLEKVAPGSIPEIRDFLEDKSMMCEIPKRLLQQQSYNDIENVLDYCSGELKEGVLQLLIRRMYSLVINDLDEIVKEANGLV